MAFAADLYCTVHMHKHTHTQTAEAYTQANAHYKSKCTHKHTPLLGIVSQLNRIFSHYMLF